MVQTIPELIAFQACLMYSYYLLIPESARTVLKEVMFTPRLAEMNSHPSFSPRLARDVSLPLKCGIHFPTSLIHIGW